MKELKEKIEAEVEEDFEQYLFKKYPSLFYTGENGELLPETQRCHSDCPKGWEPIVDNLCGAIVDYTKNTSRCILNPNKKIMRFLNNSWFVIKRKVDRKFSTKVRRVTHKISQFFYGQELYISQNPPDVKVTQFKEKFGTLRFYADGGDDCVDGMIRFAEYLSSKTCQYTGEAGDMFKKGRWCATLSPPKAEELGFVKQPFNNGNLIKN